jgi:hypothetical protein
MRKPPHQKRRLLHLQAASTGAACPATSPLQHPSSPRKRTCSSPQTGVPPPPGRRRWRGGRGPGGSRRAGTAAQRRWRRAARPGSPPRRGRGKGSSRPAPRLGQQGRVGVGCQKGRGLLQVTHRAGKEGRGEGAGPSRQAGHSRAEHILRERVVLRRGDSHSAFHPPAARPPASSNTSCGASHGSWMCRAGRRASTGSQRRT